MAAPTDETPAAPRPRDEVLAQLDEWLETPMMVLGLVWLGLLIVELVRDLPGWLEHVVTGIWAVFIADFVLRLWLSPDRLRYLRRNLLSLVALVLPALRFLRFARMLHVLRAARTTRALRLVRLGTSFNRAGHSVHALLAQRHALGYVLALTGCVALGGAAGMLAFEREAAAFEGYLHALWWTLMLLTTMGSDVWPTTGEGRLLCLVLSIYGFAVFGYITATVATWLLGREKRAGDQ